jgi:DNA-binding response OmpR family regulator
MSGKMSVRQYQYHNMPNHQILLVDDDIVLHTLLQEYLTAHNYHIHSLLNGEEIDSFCRDYQPDLVLLDIMLPGNDGLHWLKWIKKHHPNLPVMLLSAKKSADERLAGLEIGADDYLTKPFHPKELLIRIQNIIRHIPAKPNDLIAIGDNLFNPLHEKLERDDTTIKLTTQEARLLQFFCQNAGQVLTRDAISHAINGNEHLPLNRSIDMTINRLRKKLGDDANNPQYLRTIWRKGYRLTLTP